MRLISIVALGFLWGCSFNPHPPNGKQACSTDEPPQCPNRYACVDGLCYVYGQEPDAAAGGAGGSAGDSGAGGGPRDARGDSSGRADARADACVPVTVSCGSGSGKRCGKISDQCGGTVDCSGCIAGESCGSSKVCAVPCGAEGQPCCAGDKCTAVSSICSNGSCVACGDTNQICCANDLCQTAGTTCADSSTAGGPKNCLLACATTTGSCTTGTDVDCTAVCGPSRAGSRTCTCSANAWKCLTCNFPQTSSYLCYALPSPVAPCQPDTPPTVGATCTTTACMTCGNATGKGFVDAAGATRSGYCVCENNRWTCAVTRDWPCPGNPGC